MIWVNDNLIYDIYNTETVVADRHVVWARPFFKWMSATSSNTEVSESNWRVVTTAGTQIKTLNPVRYNVPIELETSIVGAGTGLRNLTLDTLKDPSDVYYNETSTNFSINGATTTRTVYFHFKNALDGRILRTMQVIQGSSTTIKPTTYNMNLSGANLDWGGTLCIFFTSIPTEKIDVSGFQKWTVPSNDILPVEFLHSIPAYTKDGEFTTITTGDPFYIMWGSGYWSTGYQTNNKTYKVRQNTSIIL